MAEAATEALGLAFPAAEGEGVCVQTKVERGDITERAPLVRIIQASSTTAPAGMAVPLASATCSSRTYKWLALAT